MTVEQAETQLRVVVPIEEEEEREETLTYSLSVRPSDNPGPLNYRHTVMHLSSWGLSWATWSGLVCRGL
jgi:hypothetical protein